MPHHRHEKLLQLIVADEIFHFLDYSKDDHQRSFAAYHIAGTVIALQEFSKILPLSLRLGFVYASQEHVPIV
jgi:DNA-binding transcriptional MocR family regulator